MRSACAVGCQAGLFNDNLIVVINVVICLMVCCSTCATLESCILKVKIMCRRNECSYFRLSWLASYVVCSRRPQRAEQGVPPRAQEGHDLLPQHDPLIGVVGGLLQPECDDFIMFGCFSNTLVGVVNYLSLLSCSCYLWLFRLS